jgi:hypothetical protein
MFSKTILDNLHEKNAKSQYIIRVTTPRPHTKIEMDRHWNQAEKDVSTLEQIKNKAGMTFTPEVKLELIKHFAYLSSLSDAKIPRSTSTYQQELDDWYNGRRAVSFLLADQYLTFLHTKNESTVIHDFHFPYLNDISIECYKTFNAYFNYRNRLDQGDSNTPSKHSYDYYLACELLSNSDATINSTNPAWRQSNYENFINFLNAQIKLFNDKKDVLFEKIINRKFYWASLGNTEVGDLHTKDGITEFVYEIYEYILNSKKHSDKKKKKILNLLSNNPHITNFSELTVKHHIICNSTLQ